MSSLPNTPATIRQEFHTAVKDAFQSASPSSQSSCPFVQWGKDPEEIGAYQDRQNASTTHDKIKASEALGEIGGVYSIQNALNAAQIPYDPNCLHLFNGANTFNIVYVHPNLQNPEVVIIGEAKGGNSRLGERNDFSNPPQKVKQGTAAYAAVEAQVMINSGDPDKTAAGTAILTTMNQNPSRVIYVGSRTKVTQSPQEPTELFCVKM